MSNDSDKSSDRDSDSEDGINSIKPGTWTNIPTCISKAFTVLLSEMQTKNDADSAALASIKSTLEKVHKLAINVERRVEILEKQQIKLMAETKSYTDEQLKQTALQMAAHAERINQLEGETSHLSEVVEGKDPMKALAKHQLVMEMMTELRGSFLEQITATQYTLKDYTARAIEDGLQIVGLTGADKKYKDLRGVLKDIYEGNESRNEFFKEITENREEYFKKIILRVFEIMEMPKKIKKMLEDDLRNNLGNELDYKVMQKVDKALKGVGDMVETRVGATEKTLADDHTLKFSTAMSQIRHLEEKTTELSKLNAELASLRAESSYSQKRLSSKVDEIEHQLDILIRTSMRSGYH